MDATRRRDPVRGALRATWDLYVAFTARVSYYNTLLLLAVVYYAVIGPIAVLRRLAGRRLLPDPRPADSYWLPRAALPRDLDSWQRMY